jgi:activator of HSP90 ATPase
MVNIQSYIFWFRSAVTGESCSSNSDKINFYNGAVKIQAKVLAGMLIFERKAMKDFKRYFILPAEPHEVYNAVTNKKILEIWTGEEAIMEAEPGTEFSLWDGSILGLNIEFEENRKVVQQWYFGEQEEPSTVTMVFHPDSKGTSVELRHINIPDEAYENIVEGWEGDYFGALRELFL